VPRLSEINIHPVKSCRGTPVESALFDRWGLLGDRRWMIVDQTDHFLTQREEPRLALVVPRHLGETLLLEAPGEPPLRLPATGSDGEERLVTVWDDTCRARDQGKPAAEWLSRYLGRPVRLVRMGATFDRPVDPSWAGPGVQVSFADSYPALIISEASLEELNRRLPSPLPMNRFRPNLVIRDCLPFAEDGWRRIRVGEVILRLVKACIRCTTTTVDQATGEKGKEPLATLATFRRAEGGVIFGQNAIHEQPGRIRVGDAVEVLELTPSGGVGPPLPGPAPAPGR
jgi:uncharacterized protein YcbX